jgi:hypothetical protein
MAAIVTGEGNLKFLAHCIDNHVEFLLIGGAAVRFYGCREGEKFDEIDLLISRAPENAERLIAALKEADVPVNFTVELPQRPNVLFKVKKHSHGYNLDLLTLWEKYSYSDFRNRSEVTTLGDLQVQVVGKADLITMKRDIVTYYETEAEKNRKDMKRDLATDLRTQAEKHRKDLSSLQGESNG